MRRLPLALVKAAAIVLLGLVGTVAGSVGAVFLTPAGRGLAGRTLSERLDGMVHGDVEVGAVGGPLWSGLELEGLVIRDTAGDPVIQAERVSAHYRLVDLLAGRIVLHDVTVVGPRVTLEKHRDGSWNVSRIFAGRGGSAGAAGPPPLIQFTGLTVERGDVTLLTPWDPPDSMRTPRLAAVALAEDRARPGRVITTGPEGYRKQVTFAGFGGDFSLLRISTPRHDPFRAVFDSLATRASDPALDLRAARGSVELEGDMLTLALDRARLPASTFTASGSVALTAVPRFDLHFVAPAVALRDLHGIVPGLPDLAGSASAALVTRADGRLAADVTALDLRGPLGAARGRLTAVTGADLPLGLERLDLALDRLDPQAFRGWVDSIPLHGRVDGHFKADGLLDALMIDADVVYRDDRVPGHPANAVSAIGRVGLGGDDGLVFDSLTLRSSDLDLATVTVFVPSNPLHGRAAVDGALAGPWKDFTWRGTALLRDGDRPVSGVRGTVVLDTRTLPTAFDAQVGLVPLVLDGLQGSFPSRPGGTVRGEVHARGTTESFALDADLHGGVGHLAGSGVLRPLPGGWGADSLRLTFDSLDLSALADTAFRTQLAGTLAGDGWYDSTGAFAGHADLRLGAGWIREVPVDSAAIRLAVDSTLLRVDTAFVRSEGVILAAAGTLGRTRAASGTLHFEGDAADLGLFDSLLTAVAGATADTGLDVRPLSGRASLVATLTGALDGLGIEAHGDVRDLAWRRWRAPSANADLHFGTGATGTVTLAARIDTASWNGAGVNEVTAGLAGRRDSLGWTFFGRLGPTDTVAAAGRWRDHGDSVSVAVDSLAAILTAHAWRLAAPATLTRAAGAWRLDSLALLARDGSGELRAHGVLPGDVPGDAALSAVGLDLRDLVGLLQRDTVGVLGRAAADLHFAGTARAPEMRGTFSLAEGGYRDFRAPYVQGALNYADRRLQSSLQLWRTGRPALAIDADLPLDLAFTGVDKRAIDGPLSVRATADSADLGLFEAFTRNLRQVRGSLDADVSLTGKWGDTRLDGTIQVADAAATLPGLGVRWDRIAARLHLAGDSVVVDTAIARGGAGSLGAKGWARFEPGKTPQVDVSVGTTDFRAMDVRNYLTLVATSKMRVRGPLFGATLTGSGTADQGALYFADLITKQIVDLEDPGTADLIDTALVREARLGPSFQNRFVDSLRIDGFKLTVGEDFWLRSADANIKLSGAATVAKQARNYRLDGTLTAERGRYSLKMGPITRDFEVDRGTVRFLGTPDLNAELDLSAHHQVRPTDGTPDIDIQAKITGTLLVPKLDLVNTGNPQMAETDLVSYMMFGRSASSLQGLSGAEGQRQQSAFSTGMSYLYAALSSEVERTLISDLGVPVDYIQIRPGGFGGGALEGATSGLATVTAGWQVGRRTYVALNAGICTNVAELSYRNFGASLEQRLQREWRATLSVEPLTTCSTAPGAVTLGQSTLYQLGLDLLWEREY